MPRKKGKLSIEEYDPNRRQFNATVQGIYESQVRAHAGVPSRTPFRDRRGVRLDVKHMFSPEDIRDLLSTSFAIATQQGQKHGYLEKGSQRATAKGRARSTERAKDKKKMAQNLRDYEETLSMSRKEHSRRIVKRGRKWIVQPDGREYKSEAGAKRYIKRMELEEQDSLPPRRNPDKWDSEDIRSTGPRAPGSPTSRWDMPSKGSPKGRGAFKLWGKYKTAQAAGGRIPPARGGGTRDFSPKIFMVERTFYPSQFLGADGQPQEMYKYAPLAKYYTIEIQAPRWMFYDIKWVKDKKRGKNVADVAPKFPATIWRPAAWAQGGVTQQELMEYEDREGITHRIVRDQLLGDRDQYKKVVYMEFNIGGLAPDGDAAMALRGFNVEAIAFADQAIWEAEGMWSDRVRYRWSSGQKGVEDYLIPAYPRLPCAEAQPLSVVSPDIHLGVLIRALKAAELFLKRVSRNEGKVANEMVKALYTDPTFKALWGGSGDGPLNQYIVNVLYGHLPRKEAEAYRITFPGTYLEGKVKGVREKVIKPSTPRQRMSLVPYESYYGDTEDAGVDDTQSLRAISTSKPPTGGRGHVVEQKKIAISDLRKSPGALFVFGDNMAETGKGGQAKYGRHPSGKGSRANTVGIPTKWEPRRTKAAYFTDAALTDPVVLERIDSAFQQLQDHLAEGGDVVWPSDGVGTGLAQLPTRAPKLFAYIQVKFNELTDELASNPYRRRRRRRRYGN